MRFLVHVLIIEEGVVFDEFLPVIKFPLYIVKISSFVQWKLVENNTRALPLESKFYFQSHF